MHLSVCTGDPVYDEISSFDYSAGYVAEGVKNRTVFHCDLVVATVPHRSCGTCQPTEWVAVMHWDGVKL